MIADAVDHHRADSVRNVREAILDREDNAVVQRIALGRAVEPHGHDRARFFDFQQLGWVRSRGAGGVSHGIYYVLCRIVIPYNEFWQESIGLCVNSVIARSESDEAIQLPSLILWIASLSLSSGARSRDPLARNDGKTNPHNTWCTSISTRSGYLAPTP